MARDSTLQERIESTLYACGITMSGDIAEGIMELVREDEAERTFNARAELTLAHAMIGTASKRDLAKARIKHALDELGGPVSVPDKEAGG